MSKTNKECNDELVLPKGCEILTPEEMEQISSDANTDIRNI